MLMQLREDISQKVQQYMDVVKELEELRHDAVSIEIAGEKLSMEHAKEIIEEFYKMQKIWASKDTTMNAKLNRLELLREDLITRLQHSDEALAECLRDIKDKERDIVKLHSQIGTLEHELHEMTSQHDLTLNMLENTKSEAAQRVALAMEEKEKLVQEHNQEKQRFEAKLAEADRKIKELEQRPEKVVVVPPEISHEEVSYLRQQIAFKNEEQAIMNKTIEGLREKVKQLLDPKKVQDDSKKLDKQQEQYPSPSEHERMLIVCIL